MDAVYESGCTFWDTADAYGDNEELIAKWCANPGFNNNLALLIGPFPFLLTLWLHRFKRSGKRDEIFLATKFGFAHGDPNRMIRADPEYVHEALNKSLSRLGVEHVDLYYAHRADPTVPIEHTVAAMAELVK